MLVDGKNQCCQNAYTAQGNLQIQCNLDQITNGIIHKTRIKKISKFVKVKVAQLCSTLCNPMDYTVHGILQAIILEWVAFPFSRGSSRDGTQVSGIAGGFFTN